MKNFRQSKAFDRIVFVCIGMVIASVIYLSGNTTEAEKENVTIIDALASSIVLSEINSQIIQNKIDRLYHYIQYIDEDDEDNAADYLRKFTKSSMDEIVATGVKNNLVHHDEIIKTSIEFINSLKELIRSKKTN